MEPEKLVRLGFTNTEAKIYLILLKLGQAQAGLISKRSQINRTTTYDALERLLKKGLIKYTIQANKKVFKPSKPEQVLNYLKEQEKLADEIIPELNKIYETIEEKEEFNLYKGIKGIRSILQDILNYKEYIAFGSSGKFLEIMKHDFLLFQKRKKELKVKSRVILKNSSRKSESVKESYASFKFIPDEFSAPTTTFVYGKNTAIIIWSEIPLAIVIHSQEVSESYSHYFELLWKIAKI